MFRMMIQLIAARSMYLSRSGIVIAIAALLIAIPLNAADTQLAGAVDSPKAMAELRIGYVPVVCGLPLYMSIDDAGFEEFGFRVTAQRYVTSDSLFADLAAGELDLAFGGTAQAIQMVDRFPDQRFHLLGIVHSSTCLIASAGPDAPKSIKELKNRKIGSFPGSIFHVYTREALAAEGLSRDSFAVIPLPAADQIAALSDGRIDALYTAEPMGYVATHKQLASYLTEEDLFAKHFLDGGYFPGGCMIVSEKFLSSNPSAFAQLVGTLQEAETRTLDPGFDMTGYVCRYTPVEESAIPVITFKGCEFGPDINWKPLELLVERFKEWQLVDQDFQLSELARGVNDRN